MPNPRTRAGAPAADTTTTAAPATREQDAAGVPGGTSVAALEQEHADLSEQLATPPDDDGAPAVERIRLLEQDNAKLREQLAAAGISAGRRTPHVPSFGISEGVRLDVEANGKANDPATGRVVTRADIEANDQRRRDAKAITDAALADK